MCQEKVFFKIWLFRAKQLFVEHKWSCNHKINDRKLSRFDYLLNSFLFCSENAGINVTTSLLVNRFVWHSFGWLSMLVVQQMREQAH